MRTIVEPHWDSLRQAAALLKDQDGVVGFALQELDQKLVPLHQMRDARVRRDVEEWEHVKASLLPSLDVFNQAAGVLMHLANDIDAACS